MGLSGFAMSAKISLRTILTRYFAVFSVVPLLVLGLMGLYILVETLSEDVRTKNQLLAETTSGQIGEALQEPVTLMLFLPQMLESGLSLDDPQEITKMLQRTVQSSNFLESLTLIDAAGKAVAVGLSSSLEDLNEEFLATDFNHLALFQSLRQRRGPIWAVMESATPESEITLALGIAFGQYSLISTLNIAFLQQLLLHLSHDQAIEISLIDRQGKIIFHPDPTMGRQMHDLSHLAPIRHGLRGESVTRHYQWKDVNYIGSVAPIRQTGWMIMVSQPRASALASVTELIGLMLITLILTAITAVAISLFLTRRLSRPLLALESSARALAKGNYAIELPAQPLKETEELADSFRTMVQAVEEREFALNRSRRHYKHLFNAGSDAILLYPARTDRAYRPLMDVNVAACQLLGYSREQLLKRSLADIDPMQGRLSLSSPELLAQLERDGQVTHESYFVDSAGQSIPVEIKAHRFDWEGQPIVLSIARDIRDRIATQKALHTLIGGFVGTTGQQSLNRIVQQICNWLGVEMATIWLCDEANHLVPQAAFLDGQLQTDLPRKSLEHSPESLALMQGQVFYPDHVKTAFPEDTFLNTQGIRGFIAQPLMRDKEDSVGLLVAMSRKPLSLPSNVWEMLQLLAAKASVEIDRLATQRALQDALIRLQEARHQTDQVLASIHDGLMVVGHQQKILLINEQAARLLQLSRAKVMGQPIQSLNIHADLLQHVLMMCKSQSGFHDIELRLPAPSANGDIDIQARSSPLPGGGCITTLRDISREKESQRLKNEFISLAAHELRTPLATIQGFTDLLCHEEEYGPFTAEQRMEYLQDILLKTDLLDRRVDDLLNLGRLESGRKISINPVETDIDALIDEIVQQRQRETRTHTFVSQLQSGGQSIVVDPDRITQVLDNLLTNAVKYSPEGGPITIKSYVEGQHYHLSIVDKGLGIAEAQLPYIFDKFYRVDRRDKRIPGLGLGLSVVKGIVEAHKGEIRIQSQLGQGTSVHIQIPLGQDINDAV